jgi:SOS-response transcriptional repressor LexA
MSLFQFWNYNRFKNPISISRDEVMRISKISSKATYHKCLKALHTQGYIKYEPSYNPFKGSHVFLFNFSDDLKPLPKNASTNFKPVVEQVVDKLQTGSETSPELVAEQVVVPYINNTNITNNLNNSNSLNLGEQAKKIEEENNLSLKNEPKEEKEKKLREKKKDSNPTIENVKSYFLQQNFPEIEAQKFYNYFSSIGWLVGGKIPMIDWPAAANNWMLNAEKFNSHQIQNHNSNLNVSTNKNYGEPL